MPNSIHLSAEQMIQGVALFFLVLLKEITVGERFARIMVEFSDKKV